MRDSSEQHYSTRCLISHRPPFRTVEPVFFRCACGAVTVVNQTNQAELPVIHCCGAALEPLPLCQDSELLAQHRITFTVFGGFEHNAIRFAVDSGSHPMGKDHRIEWMYLRTYQGGQLKYLPLNRRAVANFSLADEDAFVYCDREICRMGREHCQFQCKRGMVVYAYCNLHGLMRLKLGENGN